MIKIKLGMIAGGPWKSGRTMRFALFVLQVFCLTSLPAAETAEEKLSALTLDEKIGQTIFVYFSPPGLLSQYHIGGVLITQNMVKDSLTIKRELADAQRAMKIPLLTGIDQEGGQINRLANIPRFAKTPSAHQLSRLPPERATQHVRAVTDFLAGLGINTNLAPCLDPAFDADGDSTFMFIRQRTHGSSPGEIAASAGAFLEGVNQAGGISFLKHFPGYDTRNNSDLQVSVSGATRSDLESYIAPFRMLCRKSDGLMMNNIIYRNLDTVPAVLSRAIVTMARALDPDKVIMTDDLWAVSLREFMHPGASGQAKYPDEAFVALVKKAFEAGNDIFLITYPAKVPLMVRAIRESVERDSLALRRLDGSVLRILKLKQSRLKGW